MKLNTPIAIVMLMAIHLGSCKEDKEQPAPNLDMRPSFSAFVVSDLQTSIAWYNSVLGTSVKQTINDSAGDIAILSSPNLELELLELNATVSRNDATSGQPQGTQIQGLLKIGFAVNNMDTWLTHLNSLQVDVEGSFSDPTTGKRNILVADPDGNLIQFFEK